MKKYLCDILCLLTLASLLILFIQEQWHPFPLKPLAGVQEKTEFPKLTLENYSSGKYQSDLEQYSRENFGFREWLIRFYNQYLWDCYHITNVESVVIGKNNYIYSKNPVDDYLGTYRLEFAEDLPQLQQNLTQEALKIKKVQEILAEYGKSLFVVIEPSKVSVYPEYLPSSVTSPEGNVTAADIYPKLFDSLGVNYIDFNQYFKDIKDSVDFALYPQLGTHWSNLAALYVADSIIHYMAWLGQRDLPTLNISETRYDTTMTPDDDLEKLLNLSRSIRSVPNQYARFKVVSDSLSVKPTVITIGDSYHWNISYHVPLDSIFTRHPFWFYNSTIYYDTPNKSTFEVNYIEQLINADYVMISYSTSNLYGMSNFFSSKALVNLCHNKQEVNHAIDEIVKAIHNTPQWLESTQQKAIKQGKTVEEGILSEAAYMLYYKPETYFPDLTENHPTGRNGLLRMCDPNDPVGITLRQMRDNPSWMESIRKKAEERNLDVETVMIMDAEWMHKR